MSRQQSKDQYFFIIVSFNSIKTIFSAIESILNLHNIDPRIIVVDNASHDDTLNVCKKRFPFITYLQNTRNIGFGAAANRGIDHAMKNKAKTITLVNPDAVLHEESMARVLSHMKKNDIALASPLIYQEGSDGIWFQGGIVDFLRMRAIHAQDQRSMCRNRNNAYVSGCVMSIDPMALMDIGFFDERFFLYYEDSDLCIRAQNAGLSLAVVTDASAYHAEVSELEKENKVYYLVLSGLLFFHKHTSFLSRVYFWVHFYLRVFKNFFDRIRKKKHAKSVYKALRDFKKTV